MNVEQQGDGTSVDPDEESIDPDEELVSFRGRIITNSGRWMAITQHTYPQA
jgi:hypothetical protein